MGKPSIFPFQIVSESRLDLDPFNTSTDCPSRQGATSAVAVALAGADAGTSAVANNLDGGNCDVGFVVATCGGDVESVPANMVLAGSGGNVTSVAANDLVGVGSDVAVVANKLDADGVDVVAITLVVGVIGVVIISLLLTNACVLFES